MKRFILYANLNIVRSIKLRVNMCCNKALMIAFFTLLGVHISFAQTLAIASGQTVTISVDTYYDDVTVLSGGTLIVNSPAILTIGLVATPDNTVKANFQSGSIITINTGSTLVVNGRLTNDSNVGSFNGAVQINGNLYNTGNATFNGSLNVTNDFSNGIVLGQTGIATLNGSVQIGGSLVNTTGSTLTINGAVDVTDIVANGGTISGSGTLVSGSVMGSLGGTIFGSTGSCLSGPCDGNNLCGTGNSASLTSYSQTVCTSPNTPVVIVGNAIAPTVSYQWESSTTSGSYFATITGATNQNYTPPVNILVNTYFRRKSVKSGCTSITPQHAVLVNPTPTATAGGSQTICSNSTATVSGASAPIGTIAWTENGAGSITSGATTLTPVYTAAAGDRGNAVTLTMTVTQCSNTATATYTVNVLPAPTATAGGSQTICAGGSVTVSGASAPIGTIAWTHNGSGSISGATTLTPTYASAAGDAGNTRTLTMTVSSCGANAIATYTVIVPSNCKTWDGSSSAAWATANNWTPSGVPTTTSNVVIPSGGVPNMPTISTAANAKSIFNSGTITFITGGALNVYGNISNTGTITPLLATYSTSGPTIGTLTAAGSTVSFVGNAAQSITGVPALCNVVINKTNATDVVSLSSALIVKGTLSLTRGVLTTNSNLTINFTDGGNIGYVATDAGSISGNVTGRRDNMGVRTHYIAAPFSGVTVAQVQATTPLYVSPYWKMYLKDFTNQNWTAVTNITTAMPLGTGFSLSLPAAASLILTGTYSHSFTLPATAYSNAAASKYILVGNPYPATIDWSAASGWTKTSVANAIYYWDPANNRAASYVSGVGTNGATRYIPAMQSFMVTTTGTGGATSSVAMNNNVRLSSQKPSFFRVASDDIIRLTLIALDTTKNDEAVIRFNEMATDTFDFDLDAHKIMNSGLIPSVYTTSGKDIYSINSYASVDSVQYIPVGAKLPVDGSYKLKISGTNPNVDYILVDKQLGTQRSIDADSSYAFSGLRTDDVNRFELQLRVSAATVPTGVHSANMNSGLAIYSSTKGFVIKTDRYAGEKAEIEILDITGNSIQVVAAKKLSMGSTYIPLDMEDGSYLVKVHVEGNTFAELIVLTK